MNNKIKEIIELINTKYEDYYIDDFLSNEDVKTLADYITNLQDRIDKAIEHIKRNTKDNTFCEYYDGEVKDLLEILKGE